MIDPYSNVRAAFHTAASALLEWQDPPAPCGASFYAERPGAPDCGCGWGSLCTYGKREPASSRGLETLYGTDTYVDPYDISADWEDTA